MLKKHLSPIILLISALFLLSNCSPTVVRVPPADPPIISTPAKQLPDRVKIPPTQRPYKIQGKTYYPIPSAYGYTEAGIASWYGKKFHGRKTSNGETYDMYAATAAHKTLPMNTHLLVENLENGTKTVVRVNDRGPFVRKRIIDLSYTAAQEVGMHIKGTARVRITALGEAVSSSRGNKTEEHFLPYDDFNLGEFYVQIGSFTEKANAVRLKEAMLALGRKTVLQEFSRDSTTYYRVQVRGGRTLVDARKVEESLEERYPGAFVIAR